MRIFMQKDGDEGGAAIGWISTTELFLLLTVLLMGSAAAAHWRLGEGKKEAAKLAEQVGEGKKEAAKLAEQAEAAQHRRRAGG